MTHHDSLLSSAGSLQLTCIVVQSEAQGAGAQDILLKNKFNLLASGPDLSVAGPWTLKVGGALSGSHPISISKFFTEVAIGFEKGGGIICQCKVQALKVRGNKLLEVWSEW